MRSSKSALVHGRILEADEARDLPVWRPPGLSGPVNTAIRHPRKSLRARVAAESARESTPSLSPRPAEAAAPVSPPASPAPAAPDAAELDAIRAEAFDEGYAMGFDQGLADAAAQAEQLRHLADQAASVFRDYETVLAPRLLDLAIELAKQVVRTELETRPDIILTVLNQAFEQLVGEQTGRQIAVSPADAALLRQYVAQEGHLAGWSVVEDASITPGGLKLLSHQSLVDATVESRWRRTLATLGRSDDIGQG
jgi:flagellar assembly protein FliH